MLESRNDNKDRNDIDINDNTSGTVGFDPKTGKVYYVDEPKKSKAKEEEDLKREAMDLESELNESTEAIKALLREVGIDDIEDLDALKKLAEDEKNS